MSNTTHWPGLNFEDIQETLETLHQWIQIVGKNTIEDHALAKPFVACSIVHKHQRFTTNPIPYEGRIFQIDFDFKLHKLVVECSNAGTAEMDLYPRTVADFYQEVFEKLRGLGIAVKIHASPNEVDPAIPLLKTPSTNLTIRMQRKLFGKPCSWPMRCSINLEVTSLERQARSICFGGI